MAWNSFSIISLISVLLNQCYILMWYFFLFILLVGIFRARFLTFRLSKHGWHKGCWERSHKKVMVPLRVKHFTFVQKHAWKKLGVPVYRIGQRSFWGRSPRKFNFYRNFAMKNESDTIGGYRLFRAAPKNFLDILKKTSLLTPDSSRENWDSMKVWYRNQ